MNNYKKQLCVERAKSITAAREQYFPLKIKECVENTKQYGPDFHCIKSSRKLSGNISLVDMTTENAAKYFSVTTNGKVAVLNFASYKNPGGKFLDGSMAQEEALCHSSILYNVLCKFPEYYNWNNSHKNKGLYENRALYTPNVLFFSNDVPDTNVDVITCAAPNYNIGRRYGTISPLENYNALMDRITFVLDIAKENEVDTLILGAFGCGVFGQYPKAVAQIFRDKLYSTHLCCFENVIFAIPKSLNIANYIAFEDIL